MMNISLQRCHVELALRLSNNSSPGPDGIPYAAWRRLGTLAVDILFAAAQEIGSVDGEALLEEHYAEFNASLLLFLPKRRSTFLKMVWKFLLRTGSAP